MPTPVLLVFMLILVVLSAFFSSAEIAFAKCSKVRLKKMADDGDTIAKYCIYISENYTRSLSTILMGNNLVNIAVTTAATVLFINLINPQDGPTVATVVTTIVLLIFGETLPKIVAASIPDKMVRVYAHPMKFFMLIFNPIVTMVSKGVDSLSHLWTPERTEPEVTTEELAELVETIEEEGVFTEQESELIKSAIEFSDIMAMEILTPRVDIIGIDLDEELSISEEMLSHSRIPVYRGSLDNIIGILPAKAYMKAVISGQNFNIEEMLVKPIYVHKTKLISSIINDFRRSHVQMAVVVDEYGGTMGILTMEDIIEEIVGEIFDERDTDETEAEEKGDGVYIVEGAMNIYDLFDMIEYTPDDFETEYTTVGGWATEMLDKFPDAGDSFTCGRLEVSVLEAQAMRVEKLKVTLLPEPDGDKEE